MSHDPGQWTPERVAEVYQYLFAAFRQKPLTGCRVCGESWHKSGVEFHKIGCPVLAYKRRVLNAKEVSRE